MSLDPNFHSCQPFCYDSNEHWWTFDIIPIAHRFEQYPWTIARDTEKSKVVLPVIKQPGNIKVSDTALLSPPIAGYYTRTQRFGENPKYYQEKFGIPAHNGTDFGANEGSAVLSVGRGKVGWVGTDPNYGHYIRIYHEHNGFHTFYAHLLQLPQFKVGDTVEDGQQIGLVGSTGNSTGPHLHFEVRLANLDGSYAEGQFGHGKGRVDPETIFHVFNGA